MNKRPWSALILLLSGLCLAAGVAQAQVPPDIEAQLVKIGHVIDVACTAKIYRPLMPKNDVTSNVTPLYPGITIARDISFGPDPKDVVDVFAADKGPASRPVLIYVPGGPGNKIEIQSKDSNAFYDNIMRWAAENGMVGVNMQRHGLAPGAPPDYYAGAKDISAMIVWIENNISKYNGNPNRMFIWAQSVANTPLGIYIGHPELYGSNGAGVKGAIFMSGGFNILRPDGTNPLPPPAPPPPAVDGGVRGNGGGGGAPSGGVVGAGTSPAGPAGGGAGIAARGGAISTCGAGGAGATDGVLPGRAPGQPGGPNPQVAIAGGRGPAPTPISLDELIGRSNLPAFEKTDVKILLASGDLDIGGVAMFNQALHDELCKLDGPKAIEGKGHCPMILLEKGESHLSEVFSIDTPDQTVSGPILKWMRGIKH